MEFLERNANPHVTAFRSLLSEKPVVEDLVRLITDVVEQHLPQRLEQNSTPGWLTIAEASKRIRRSPATTYRLIQSGQLSANRALGHMLVSSTELDRFMAAGESH